MGQKHPLPTSLQFCCSPQYSLREGERGSEGAATDLVPLRIGLTPGALVLLTYRIYSNKRRGAYLIFRATSAALIRGRHLFKHWHVRRARVIFFFVTLKHLEVAVLGGPGS